MSNYTAHQPDEWGMIDYSEAEHAVWRILFDRQIALVPGKASDAFLSGLKKLGITGARIPQLPDVSRTLREYTGWEVVPVPALISAREFFELLANRRFPAATFIRREEELNYLKEPDLFHELFGHCPLLTDSVYADFLHRYAACVLTFPEKDWPLLQRLFWFTVEFGLIQTDQGLRAYGGGILSSITETPYSVQSHIPMRILFDPVVVFRMPYRIDQLQTVYFVINSYQQLFDVVDANLSILMDQARTLKEYPPLFSVEEEGNPNVHIHAC